MFLFVKDQLLQIDLLLQELCMKEEQLALLSGICIVSGILG